MSATLHIGHMIEAELRRQGRSVTWLAKQIPCDRTNVYKILNRTNIDIQLLVHISRILNHDFFLDISISLSQCV